LSVTNPTWTVLDLSRDLHGKRPTVGAVVSLEHESKSDSHRGGTLSHSSNDNYE